MIQLIQDKLEALATACRRHGVERLEIFGSAADAATFDPARSDIDFLVRFRPGLDLGPWMKVYFDLRNDLQRAIGRSVDLVMEGALRNPGFIREANKTRQVVYAAQSTEAA